MSNEIPSEDSSSVLPNPLEQKINEIKQAIQDASESEVAFTGKNIADFAERVAKQIYIFYTGKLGSDAASYIQSDRLTTLEKVGATAGTAISVVPTYANIIRIVTPIPAIQLAASIASVIGAVTEYKEDKLERDFLRKKQITTKKLNQLIKNQNYSLEELHKFYHYLSSQSFLYNTLYSYRKLLLTDTTLPLEERSKKVKTINNIIESMSQDKEIKKQDLDELKTFSNLLETQIESINHHRTLMNDYTNLIPSPEDATEILDKYESGRVYFKEIKNIDKNLLEAMKEYKKNANAIYSQDLPSATKDLLFKMSESVDPNLEDVSLLKASLINHYINSTAKNQIALQDADLNLASSKVLLSKKDLEQIENFYKRPREILNIIGEVKNKILSNEQLEHKNKLVEILNKITMSTASDLFLELPNINADHIFDYKQIYELMIQEDPQQDGKALKDTIENLENIINTTDTKSKIDHALALIEKDKDNFNDIFSSDLLKKARTNENIENLKNSIILHKKTSLAQHSQELLSILPNIIVDTGNEKKISFTKQHFSKLEILISKIILNKIMSDNTFKKLDVNEKMTAIKHMVTDETLKTILGEHGLERFKMEKNSEKEQIEISEQFKSYLEKNSKDISEIVSNIFDRANLETSTTIRKGILAAELGTAALHVAGTLATPAAPLSLGIGVLGSAAGIAITGTGIALDVLSEKTDDKKEDFKESIAPSRETEAAEHRKTLRKLEKERKKEEASKTKSSGIQNVLSEADEVNKQIRETSQIAQLLEILQNPSTPFSVHLNASSLKEKSVKTTRPQAYTKSKDENKIASTFIKDKKPDSPENKIVRKP